MQKITIKALETIVCWDDGASVVINADETGLLTAAKAQTYVDSGKAEFGDLDMLSDDLFKMEHKGFGRYELSGPGIEEGTVATNKAQAEAIIEKARASLDDLPPA